MTDQSGTARPLVDAQCRAVDEPVSRRETPRHRGAEHRAEQVALWDISDPRVPRLVNTVAVPGTLPPGVALSLSVWFGPGGHQAVILDGVLGAVTLLDVDRHQVSWTRRIGGAFDEPAFAPDGSTLAIGNVSGGQTTLRFFDTQNGNERRSLSVGETVGVTYARGGSVFVTTGVVAGGQGGAHLSWPGPSTE
jgi:hypothetical protein